MTTREFVDARTEALRYWFRGYYGRHWHACLIRALGQRARVDIFHYRSRPVAKFTTLQKLEALALAQGWNPAGRLGLLRFPPQVNNQLSSEPESSRAPG